MARARSLGAELAAVHQWLRAELTRIRDDVDACSADSGRADPSTADSGTGPQALRGLLQVRCIAFCRALTSHHTSEDNTAFPELAEASPELADVLERLRQDHRLVAGILVRLSEILSTLTPDNRGSVTREIDGLTAILESHFQWEERRLVAALDALDTPRQAEELFGLSAGEEIR
jgi:hypothetical protein